MQQERREDPAAHVMLFCFLILVKKSTPNWEQLFKTFPIFAGAKDMAREFERRALPPAKSPGCAS